MKARCRGTTRGGNERQRRGRRRGRGSKALPRIRRGRGRSSEVVAIRRVRRSMLGASRAKGSCRTPNPRPPRPPQPNRPSPRPPRPPQPNRPSPRPPRLPQPNRPSPRPPGPSQPRPSHPLPKVPYSSPFGSNCFASYHGVEPLSYDTLYEGGNYFYDGHFIVCKCRGFNRLLLYEGPQKRCVLKIPNKCDRRRQFVTGVFNFPCFGRYPSVRVPNKGKKC